jgi:hypothetical protein
MCVIQIQPLAALHQALVFGYDMSSPSFF